MIYQWMHLTGAQLEALTDTSEKDEAAGHCVAVTVLGAVEQHGPHLPLGTDVFIGEALLERALALLDEERSVLMMPTVTISASEEHLDFTGTLSVSAAHVTDQLMAQASGLAQAGINRWVWVNAHGGNVGLMESAALTARTQFGVLVAKAYYPKFAPMPDGPSAQELRTGLHGGEVETSMMLAIAPELVDLNKVADFSLDQPPWAGQAPVAWLAQDLNDNGVVGRASLANPAQGEALLRHYGQGLAEVIEAMTTRPLPY